MMKAHSASDALLRNDVEDGIVLLTLNRPAKLNALNYALVDALLTELERIERSEEVRAVIVTGAGRAFCAGADIEEFRRSVLAGVTTAVRDFCRRGQRLTAMIESFPKPVIAAVNGLAFGGGCEIVEATHVTVASDAATFGKPEIKLGMVPTFGGTQRLPRLVGRKRALHAILSGESFDAEAAHRMGLVTSIVRADALLDAAIAVARSFVRHSPVAVRACLAAVTRG
jgi:enoyl-CoA hydratase/carnithine racemase